MKKFLMALVIFIIGSGVFHSISEAKEKAKFTLKMATLHPRGTRVMKILDRLRAETREQTNNEVDYKFYWGAVQGDEDAVLRKMRLKQLDGGAFTGHGLGQMVPAVRVTEIPYTYRNYGEVSYVRSRLKDTMNKNFEDAGYVVIGWGEVGFVHHFSKVPITSVEVARKQKWWAWEGDPIAEGMFEALDITPVPLSFTDVMTSLSTRLVDTAPTTPFAAVAFRWHTRFKYMSEYPSTNIQGGLVVRKEVWDKISPESQKKMKEISKRHHDKLIRASREENEKSIEVLKKSGISIVHGDPEQLQFIFDAAKKARENLVGRLYSRELLERALLLLDEYRRNHPNSTVRRIE